MNINVWKYYFYHVGGGGKAFCAGGDVVTITKDKSGKAAVDFFRDEYKLDALTASLTVKAIFIFPR